MALEDVLERIRRQNLGTTEDNRVVDRGPSAPIQRNRPRNLTALENKWADPEFTTAVTQLPQPVIQAIRNTDLKRIDRGQTPVNAENSIKAGLAAMTGQAVTPVSDRRDSWTSIPANAVGDLAQIVKSLPQLPQALAGEVTDLADGFTDDRRELAEQGRTGLAATLSLPGIRMIPGTYFASNLLSNRQAFIEDPLLNALDVLPIASKAARGTKVVKAAEEAALADRINLAGTTRLQRPVRPLATVATRKLDAAGNVVPNRLGDLMDRGWSTKAGTALKETFGKDARDVSRTGVIAEQTAERRAFFPAEDDMVGQQFKKWHDLNDPENLAREYNLTPERATEIGAAARVDRNLLTNLPENEARFIADWDATNETLARYMESKGELVRVGGEWFTKQDGRRLLRSQEVMGKKFAEVFGDLEVGGKNPGIMADIDALAAVDPRWARIRDLIDGRDLNAAASEMTNLIEGTKKVNRLRWYNNAAVPLSDQRMFAIRRTLNEAKGMATAYDRLRKNMNPARYDELINDIAGKQYIESLYNRSVIPDMEAAQKFLETGMIDQITRDLDPVAREAAAREWGKIRGQVRRTWETLKANGQDPVFMGRVTEARARRIGVARFDGTNRSMATARKRISDVSPSLNSPSIALTNQAWDIIQSEGARQMADDITSDFGRPQQQLLDEFTPMAEEVARRQGRSDVSAVRQDLISRQWMPFDPGSMMPFAGVASPLGEQVWIPRAVGETLKRMNSEGLSKMRAFSDPVTRLWRVALLPLSPRWHLYNIIGGAVMMSSEVGPQAVRHLSDARAILKANAEGTPLPRHIPRELQRQLGMIGREEAELALKQGASLSRWWNESLVGKAGRGFVQKSFDLNSTFDDAYKVMSYLEGEAQALKRFQKAGVDENTARLMAQEEGIKVARKVLQDVGGMTPFERSVLRQIFPFYSWLSHLMRFVVNYPMDHPWRAAIVAAGSRIAMEDMGDGASTDMLDIISWGERDEQGRQRGLNVRGLNPFSDAANLFTLAGWLGSTNPLFQTATQALGFDPQQGGIDLYPQVSYSPETGKMVVDSGNPVTNFAINSLPQLGALYRYAGMDEDFNKLMREDPETAQRILFSGVGIPGSYRRYSREEDMIGNELKRQEAASNATTVALRTGNLDALEPFFGPEGVAALKAARESGDLDQFLPSTTPTPREVPQ